MSLLNEILKSFTIPDRNDPNKTVDIFRYVIDPKEKPTAVVFGKFIPWTGKLGHGRLVALAEKIFGKGNVVIASPKRKGTDKNVDIFNDEQKEKIIKEANPGIQFFRIDSGIPIRMFTELIRKYNIQRPVIIVGPDRVEEFHKYFKEYDPNNKGTEDQTDKDFGKGEFYYIQGDRDTSATKVREALLKGNKEEFIRLTGYKENMWNLMQDMIKKNGSVKENLMRFTQFYSLVDNITEGGNVVVRGVPANKIPIAQIDAKTYDSIRNDILGAIRAINIEYKNSTGKELWPNIENLIKTLKIFSGSTRLFFMKNHDEFAKHKKTVGDIDLQFPDDQDEELNKFLDANEGKKFGKLTYLGKGGRSPTQTNTIFQTNDYPGVVKSIQLDFEPTFWEKGIPTEFSTFAHYSSWEDIKENIKGVFIKWLLRSIIGREKIGDIAVLSPAGKSIAKKEKASKNSFSVDKGVRARFEPVTDGDIKGAVKDTKKNIMVTKDAKGLKGVPIEDGLPIYKEIDSKTATYEKNLDNIFALAFGKAPTDEEKHMFHSYIGTLQLMKKYLKPEEIKHILSSFSHLIWGEQEVEQQEKWENGINTNDNAIKMAAYNKFIQVFPELKIPEVELNDMIKKFYEVIASRKAKAKAKA